MAHSLDAEVRCFRNRPPDAGPYPIVLGQCAGGHGPRGWQDRERPRPRRHRGERRGPPRDPRHRDRHQQGQGRLALVVALAGGTRALGGGARDLEMPTRGSPRRSQRRCPGPSGSGVARTTRGICWQTSRSREHPSSRNSGAHHRRPARSHGGGGSVPPGHRGTGWEAARGCLSTSSRPAGTCWPCRTSARELWRQIWSTNPQGALAQGDPPAHGCSGDLSGSWRHHPPVGSAPHRRDRGVGRAAPAMSAEALAKVQRVRFADADDATEPALPASLTVGGSGRITRWSLHHCSGRGHRPRPRTQPLGAQEAHVGFDTEPPPSPGRERKRYLPG